MDITQLPFNELIGLETCDPKTEREALLRLPDHPKYTNHLGTLHAAALFSLAEASSGLYLWRNLGVPGESILPVVRRAEIKYRKPATGTVWTQGKSATDDWEKFHADLVKRGRALISFQIEILSHGAAEPTVAAVATFDWFVATRDENS